MAVRASKIRNGDIALVTLRPRNAWLGKVVDWPKNPPDVTLDQFMVVTLLPISGRDHDCVQVDLRYIDCILRPIRDGD